MMKPIDAVSYYITKHNHNNPLMPGWSAFCPEFDLAVDGYSREEVVINFREITKDYLLAVGMEGASRPAPLMTRIKFWLKSLFSKNVDRDFFIISWQSTEPVFFDKEISNG